MNPGALYDQGFHPTPVSGSFGAAVAAGRLLGLDRRQFGIALGLAQTQTSGLLAWKEEPTESFRPFNPGIAARNGTTAALLADLEFGTPVDPFEGEYNVFRAFSDGEEAVDELDRELGASYRVTEHAFKRYSSVAFSHTGLDALLALRSHHDVAPDEIERIEVRFPATGAELIDDADLRSHSLRYLIAVAAVEGTVTIDDIVTDRTSDPRVAALIESIDLVRDEELDALFPDRYTSVIELETTDGRYSKRVDHAKGTPEKPFDRGDVEEKFRRLSAETTPDERQSAIVETLSEIERMDDVGELAGLLSTGEATDGSE
jgi:2-methylcitrate dehydratase PrpD